MHPLSPSAEPFLDSLNSRLGRLSFGDGGGQREGGAGEHEKDVSTNKRPREASVTAPCPQRHRPVRKASGADEQMEVYRWSGTGVNASSAFDTPRRFPLDRRRPRTGHEDHQSLRGGSSAEFPGYPYSGPAWPDPDVLGRTHWPFAPPPHSLVLPPVRGAPVEWRDDSPLEGRHSRGSMEGERPRSPSPSPPSPWIYLEGLERGARCALVLVLYLAAALICIHTLMSLHADMAGKMEQAVHEEESRIDSCRERWLHNGCAGEENPSSPVVRRECDAAAACVRSAASLLPADASAAAEGVQMGGGGAGWQGVFPFSFSSAFPCGRQMSLSRFSGRTRGFFLLLGDAVAAFASPFSLYNAAIICLLLLAARLLWPQGDRVREPPRRHSGRAHNRRNGSSASVSADTGGRHPDQLGEEEEEPGFGVGCSRNGRGAQSCVVGLAAQGQGRSSHGHPFRSSPVGGLGESTAGYEYVRDRRQVHSSGDYARRFSGHSSERSGGRESENGGRESENESAGAACLGSQKGKGERGPFCQSILIRGREEPPVSVGSRWREGGEFSDQGDTDSCGQGGRGSKQGEGKAKGWFRFFPWAN
uniref:Brl1/Brr6 domain-containing protein n=1 Tax=Chromera velia CCMP2878 TaxID=1169474 RepID=A0A0G4G6Q2_9ALVE|eukprot:Cvel_20535.t1-p1 / transcript=Cvel_20535.t1 / gene=Cvel_20535 / organism=Chromera_velia_CCMP2878 / gene_product=hypothetical protein / transcript_product=hypothetical protein / location=Cvel_scaffold1851:28592-33872(+) / protein_length=588 / sequence_SO=supercontig / SO=protein_coding / is_pseudo=false